MKTYIPYLGEGRSFGRHGGLGWVLQLVFVKDFAFPFQGAPLSCHQQHPQTGQTRIDLRPSTDLSKEHNTESIFVASKS